MKTLITGILAVLFAGGFAFGQDEEAIKKVIQISYVDGLQNKGKSEDIEKGFHPGFELLGINEGQLTKWPIYSWIEYHEKKLAKDPSPPADNEKVTAKFPMIDITGDAAVVKVELYKDKNLIFTDYLSLYKFEEGWKIVSKIYFRHEKK
ncbi:MAG: nuclear transport factor 2 family protein [Bacteroidales bacterium]|nr:nuclear transport factor 2 family protein [Bacteroidales bacterium]